MSQYNNVDSSIDLAAVQVMLGEEIRAFEERLFARSEERLFARLEEQQHRLDASLMERMASFMERLQRIEASLEASGDESDDEDDAAMQAIEDEAMLAFVNAHEDDEWERVCLESDALDRDIGWAA